MPGGIPFVGRELEMEAVRGAIASAAAGTPTIVLIEGEGGAGRTALLNTLETSPMLPRRRIRTHRIDLAAMPAVDPVEHAALHLTRYGRFTKIGGRRRLHAAIRRLTPDWIGAIPVWGDILAAVTSTAEALRRRRGSVPAATLPEDIAELQRVARQRAAALLVDDAHLATRAASERLHRLLATAEMGTRLLVIATYRAASPGAPLPDICHAAAALPAERRVTIAMRPLGVGAVQQYLEATLEGPVAASLVDDVLAASYGLPSGMLRRLDSLRGRGALVRGANGWSMDASADVPVEAETEPDLGPLGVDVAETLAFAARLTDEFDTATLARELGRDELWVEDRLAAAARVGVLQLVDGARDIAGDITSIYRFARGSTRAALRRLNRS